MPIYLGPVKQPVPYTEKHLMKKEPQFPNWIMYSYPTSFGQVPVLVISFLKCSLLKNFDLVLHL